MLLGWLTWPAPFSLIATRGIYEPGLHGLHVAAHVFLKASGMVRYGVCHIILFVLVTIRSVQLVVEMKICIVLAQWTLYTVVRMGAKVAV
jgi:hypothetical protein